MEDTLMDDFHSHLSNAEYSSAYYIGERIHRENTTDRLHGRFALFYMGMGQACLKTGRNRDSIQYFRLALEVANSSDPNNMEMKCKILSRTGIALLNCKKFDEAWKMQQTCLDLAHQIDDSRIRILTFCNLGNICFERNQLVEARDYYQKYLEGAKLQGFEEEIGSAYGNLSNLFWKLGRYRESHECNKKRLELMSKMKKDGCALVRAACALGGSFFDLGFFSEAMICYTFAQKRTTEFEDTDTQYTTHMNLGILFLSVGCLGQAARCFRYSLLKAREIGDKYFEGRTYGCIARIFECLVLTGSHVQAFLDFASQLYDLQLSFLTVVEDTFRSPGKGNIYLSLHEYEKAELAFRLESECAEEEVDRHGECAARLNRGLALIALHRLQEANEELKNAQQLAEDCGSEDLLARSKFNLARIFISQGQNAQASDILFEAIQHCEKMQHRLENFSKEHLSLFDMQRECYDLRMEVLFDLGNEREALIVAESAKAKCLRAAQCNRAVRIACKTCDENLKSAEDLINACCRSESFEELKKTRICWEAVENAVRAQCGYWVLTYAQPKKDRLYTWLLDPNAKVASCRKFDLSPWFTMVGVEHIAAFLGMMRYVIGADERNYDERGHVNLPGENATVSTSDSESSDHRDEPDISTYDRVMRILNLMIEKIDYYDNPCLYSSQEQDVAIWLDLKFINTHSTSSSESSGISEATAAAKKIKVHVKLWKDLTSMTDQDLLLWGVTSSKFRNDLLLAVKETFNKNVLLNMLHEMLIAPVRDLLPLEASLLIVPDMDLFMVPWAALSNGQSGRRLIENYALRIAPSLVMAYQNDVSVGNYGAQDGFTASGGNTEDEAMDEYRSTETDPKRILIVGNPWPLHSTVKEYLKHSSIEACSLARVLETTCLLEASATRTEILKCIQNSYWVHFACHASLATQALHLSIDDSCDDGLLRAEDVQVLVRLAAGSTVVLSGCDTGRGDVRGEGVVGLARAFFAAGAGAVLMSLWSIRDGATCLLMQAMYCALMEGYHLPQALRFAMLMMCQHPKVNAQEVLLQSWAGFVITGCTTTLIGHGTHISANQEPHFQIGRTIRRKDPRGLHDEQKIGEGSKDLRVCPGMPTFTIFKIMIFLYRFLPPGVTSTLHEGPGDIEIKISRGACEFDLKIMKSALEKHFPTWMEQVDSYFKD